MKEIASALVKAQKAFGPALKTSTNPHFRNRYAALDACIEAVIDALNDNGIMLMQQTHLCEDGVIVETIFIHESGETMSGGKLHVPAAKHDPQGYGSALTYAKRYSLQSACGIAPIDDDGSAATAAVQQKQAAPAKPAATPAKAPTKVEGKDTPWQLKIVAKPDGNHGEWSQLVIDATMLQLDQANTEADVLAIFKTNRNIYEEMKAGGGGDQYGELMELFKEKKSSFKSQV